MLAIGHFALGALIALLIIYFLLPKKRLLWLDTVAILIGGTIAVIPDIVKQLTGSSFLEEHIVGNIFFFHQLFDTVPWLDTVLVSGIVFVIFIAVAGGILWSLKP